MRSLMFLSIFSALQLAASDKLSYVAEPQGVYVAPKPANITKLLEFVDSREDLSNLSAILREPAGFVEAFDAAPTWSFTFLAPSNEAFENTGAYYSSFAATRLLIGLKGIVHIIDRILDPSAQIFESDLPKISQTFIAGSCSNPKLSYC
ncbi:hypothetical protein N7454_005951 [Penicillium verhagenii]|nr:hypothetical protein N7454_005951 [Penicillium verhagenii]